MKASKKYLIMEIEFSDYSDLKRAFNKAWESMKCGKDWNRFKAGSAICQFQMERAYEEEDDKIIAMNYREEEIDGKLCIVIPSKMNKE